MPRPILDRMTDAPVSARARNPLAFLDAEIEELKAKGLYRRLRVVAERAEEPLHHRRPRGHHALEQQLPRPQHASEAPPGRARRGRALRRRLRGGAHDRRHDEPPRGARGAPGDVQAHRGGPDVPVRVHRQHRRDPDPGPGGRDDRQRRAQPRQHHRRHPPDEGRAQDLPARRHRRAAQRPPRGARGRCGRHDPRHHRRRLQHGRRHREAAGHRRGRGGGRCDRHGRRRARLRRPGPQRARNGRPLRPPRPRARPGRHAVEGDRRAGRLRRRQRRACGPSSSTGRAHSSSRPPIRRRSRRPASPPSTCWRPSRS